MRFQAVTGIGAVMQLGGALDRPQWGKPCRVRPPMPRTGRFPPTSGQVLAEGVGGGVGSTAGADLRVDVGHVPLDGLHAEEQALGYLLVGPPVGDEPKDLYLAVGEPVG